MKHIPQTNSAAQNKPHPVKFNHVNFPLLLGCVQAIDLPKQWVFDARDHCAASDQEGVGFMSIQTSFLQSLANLLVHHEHQEERTGEGKREGVMHDKGEYDRVAYMVSDDCTIRSFRLHYIQMNKGWNET
jgi:hypothetical protein